MISNPQHVVILTLNAVKGKDLRLLFETQKWQTSQLPAIRTLPLGYARTRTQEHGPSEKWQCRLQVRGSGMDDWPAGWRFWLLVVLLFAFPVVLHPWWLFTISAGSYVLLVWATVGTTKKQK